MKQYELAIISCTARKNYNGRTAITLYTGGAFNLTVRHARSQADQLLILSSKYGLLWPDSPVENYDLYLPDLFGFEREELVEKVSQQVREMGLGAIHHAVSYLPKAYFELLEEAAPDFASRMDRPFKGVGMMAMWKQMSADLRDPSVKRGLIDE